MRCEWLARQLETQSLAILYSSPEAKARQTGEIVGRKLGVNSLVFEGLQENDRTGFRFFENEVEWKRRFKDFFQQPTQRLIGNESANEALARFSEAVFRIVSRHSGQNIGIVAHGTVISLFAAHHGDAAPFQIWDSLNPLPAFLALRLPGYTLELGPTAFPV